MNTVAQIESAVSKLSPKELCAFRKWFAEFDGDQQGLDPENQTPWNQVNDFRDRLAATKKNFSDSAELIREDRER